jgi:U3 small nucleolar RNA-associated protein 3
MEAHEPLKLALARDYPLVVHRLEKTARGIQRMMAEGEQDLHKGLGWLHYRMFNV